MAQIVGPQRAREAAEFCLAYRPLRAVLQQGLLEDYAEALEHFASEFRAHFGVEPYLAGAWRGPMEPNLEAVPVEGPFTVHSHDGAEELVLIEGHVFTPPLALPGCH